MATKLKSPESVMEENILASGVELIPSRFYFVSLTASQVRNYPNFELFSVENELEYEPFLEDFGPLNIAHLFKYCDIMNKKIGDLKLKHKKIVQYSSHFAKRKLNAAFLAGSYCVICMDMDPLVIYNKLSKMCRFIEFRDASVGHAQYTISLKDCLLAVGKAREVRFFDFSDFCWIDYVHYETVQNGDLNWIVPEKLVAFAGPHSKDYKNTKLHRSPSSYHTPEYYVPYFKSLNVKVVIRLNNACYSADKFKEAGIEHHDIIFPDGGVPSDELLNRFLKIVESTNGAVAVHCKAGLGRTGSMIACYIMKWYKFAAKEAIAWLRICRPASIIGQQQNWLIQKQSEMWIAGLRVTTPKHRFGIYSYFHGEQELTKLRVLRDKAKAGKRGALESVRKLENQVNTMNLSSSVPIKAVGESSEKLTQGDQLQQIKFDRQSASASKALRSSWPMTVNTMTTRRAIATNVTRKTVSAGKTTPPKRTSLRKKTPTKVAEENDESVATTPPTGAAAPVLRRSARIVYPRGCKSLALR